MIQTAITENAFALSNNPIETARRRSTFYVPLVTDTSTAIDAGSNADLTVNENFCTELKRSIEKIYNPDLSACSFEWSLNESDDLMVSNEPEPTTSIRRTASALSNTALAADESRTAKILKSHSTDFSAEINNKNKSKRYGIVLNGINLDGNEINQNENNEHQKSPSNTSTPTKLLKSRSRSNILCLPDKSFQLSPLKEKSKTLPQNLSPKVLSTATSAKIINGHPNGGHYTATFPPKYSFLLKSSPKISLNYSSGANSLTNLTPPTQSISFGDNKKSLCLSPSSGSSPRKALSFIRRAHSTKLSRSNSLLKSLTSKCVDQSAENLWYCNYQVCELQFERFEECFKVDNFYELIKAMFLKEMDKRHASTAATTGNITRELTDCEKCDDEVHSGKFY